MGAHLVVRNITAVYRGITAVDDVSLDLAPGECVAVIGANGAGKTSLLRAISGLMPNGPRARIELNETRIDGLPAEKRVAAGIGHVLEGRHIFPTLSVLQNLRLGGLRLPDANAVDEALTRVYEWFPDLKPLSGKTAASLSGGQQQFLAIGRALMAQPAVLLLDEPSVGLAPILVRRIVDVLQMLNEEAVTVLLVEQSLEIVQAVASTVHVLSHGRIAATTRGDDKNLAETSHLLYLA